MASGSGHPAWEAAVNSGLAPSAFNKWLWLERVAEAQSLSDAVKLYAVALWRGANENGYLWANHEHLESWIGHSSTGKSSKKAKALADGGWLYIKKQKLANGFFSNAYQLRFPTNVGTNTVKQPIPKETTEPQAKSAPSSLEDFIGYEADGSPRDRRQPPPWVVDNDR
jgi:hypothetical protein